MSKPLFHIRFCCCQITPIASGSAMDICGMYVTSIRSATMTTIHGYIFRASLSKDISPT